MSGGVEVEHGTDPRPEEEHVSGMPVTVNNRDWPGAEAVAVNTLGRLVIPIVQLLRQVQELRLVSDDRVMPGRRRRDRVQTGAHRG